jgi:hypothetical protein
MRLMSLLAIASAVLAPPPTPTSPAMRGIIRSFIHVALLFPSRISSVRIEPGMIALML